MSKDTENDVEDVKCPGCGYFTTTEELEWEANTYPPRCFCPECGFEFEVLPENNPPKL